MYIRFWGVRGSIATPLTNAELEKKIKTAVKLAIKAGITDTVQVPDFLQKLPLHIRRTVGGDTACVEIQAGGKILILDAGTGFRRLGLDLIKRSGGNPIEAHILMTHTHWDHISGIPFFVPAFSAKNNLTFYSPFPGLKERLARQQNFEYFPAPLSQTFQFVRLNENASFHIGDIKIENIPLIHPGGIYSYRITHGNKTIVYATDSEYKKLSPNALKPFTDFFHGTDILIFDAQYTMLENVEKEDWGHSNVFTGIDMAIEAEVKKLVFIHHEPGYNDEKLYKIFLKAKEYVDINQPKVPLKLILASEGLSMTV
ncbi:MAG: MBL fold metallo-hydrolase [Thermodesulfobacteriota bacterium]|nr:MBL fold metallo-hydrolase [Thermodesulfobacteriota bacterium]